PAQSNAELKEQIKTSIQAAQEAAREAGQEAARAAQEAARAGNADRVFRVVPPVPPTPPLPGFSVGDGGFGGNDGFPRPVRDISIAFFVMCAVMVIGWPIARAFGRRLERRAEVPQVNPGMQDQLQRIEQAVDAMSIEIERISESQRFMAKLQNSQSAERLSS
ncbi:MAG: hypothetical protein ABI625_02125, partial [bacterium]